MRNECGISRAEIHGCGKDGKEAPQEDICAGRECEIASDARCAVKYTKSGSLEGKNCFSEYSRGTKQYPSM